MGLKKEDFYVGQELIRLPSYNKSGAMKTKVHSVGRKYVYLGYDNTGHRIDLTKNNNFYEIKDCGTSGRFFFSEEEYNEYIERRELLIDIRNNLQMSDNVPIDVLRDMAKYLKGENSHE